MSYVDVESRIPEKHSQRKIRAIVNEALAVLDGNFGELPSEIGRPSIPPERLLRTMLLQIFYALRSERLLVQRLDFDLSFRWFVGLGIDERVWDASSFSKNRDHLLDGDVAVRFLAATLDRPKVKRLVSTEHFSVDGTLIEAWASMKSFRRRTDDSSGGPPADGGFLRQTARWSQWQVDFHGEKRSNATHASTTDSDAMLCRKSPGAGARLCHMHVLVENRNGLVADVEATRASRHAERMAAVERVKGVTSASGTRRATVGADPGYALSIRVRKRIEEVFGWVKAAAGQRKTEFRGLPKVRFAFTFAVAAYNLVRLPKLLAE